MMVKIKDMLKSRVDFPVKDTHTDKDKKNERIRELLEEFDGLKDRKDQIKREIQALTNNQNYRDDKFEFKKMRHFSGYKWDEMPEEVIDTFEDLKGEMKDLRKIMLSYAVYKPIFYVRKIFQWKGKESGE